MEFDTLDDFWQLVLTLQSSPSFRRGHHQEEHDMRLMMQGLTDAAFEQRFGAEDACLAALAAARQAAGMACPRCGNPKSYVYGRRVGCTRCNQRWSVTSGTVMA